MGNLYSQYVKEVLDEAVECEYGPGLVDEGCSSCPNPTCGPGSTPKLRVLECDPRSPTEGITRTPIEISSATKEFRHNTYESHQWKFQDEHTPSMVHDLKHNYSVFDPRSPAASLSFKRTPIQFLDVSANLEEIESSDEIEQVLNVTPLPGKAYHVSDTDQEPIEKMPNTMTVPDKLTEADRLKEETPNVEIGSVGILSQEVSEADVHRETSADLDTSEVVTPLRTLAKIDQLPCSTVEDVEKIEHNSSIPLLDTPKSTDKTQHQIKNNKENNSIMNKIVFRTPETKAEVGVKPKVRTPLGTLSGTNSPMQMLRDKQSSLVKKGLSTRPPQFQQLNRTTID